MTTCLDQESDFRFDELFFSRTNKKGIIQAGNSVFQRVSQYGWEEILSRPHNVIRHPKMPKGVFHLLWETILSGAHVGAYVINRAKDGSHYWVFALVSPIEEGFLSVRLKPSSPIFQEIKKRYDELLQLEKSQGLSPRESHRTLLAVVEGLGFKDYRQLMVEALTQEIEARQNALGAPPIQALVQLRGMLATGAKLRQSCEDIFAAYRKSAFVPINLKIHTERIGPEAVTIAVVSTRYEALALQIQEETKRFMEMGSRVQEKIEKCQFDTCNAILQEEMRAFFDKDSSAMPIEKETEMRYLAEMAELGIREALGSLKGIEREFSLFQSVHDQVRNLAAALEIVSLTGKIEAAKVRDESGTLHSLLDELGVFKKCLKASLAEIEGLGETLLKSSRGIEAQLSAERKAAASSRP